MNEIFDNISKVAKSTAKKAMKVSGDVVELTKTSLNIKVDEIKREGFYKEIGKIIYSGYQSDSSSVDGAVSEFCKCIDELNRSISEQISKSAGIKNQKFCIGCGNKLNIAMLFCPRCGKEIGRAHV